MPSLLRLSALRERLRSSLWLWPALTVTAAVALGVLLPRLEDPTAALGFAGGPDGARAVLSAVAGSMITVTGLTFSLTVVALQMASSQFTPRLMRTFLADGGNQAVLSVFLGTFAYTITVLRSVQSAIGDQPTFVPDLAVGVGLVLTGLSVAMLVFFIHHLTQQLRVESVLAEVQRDTIALIHQQLPDEAGDTARWSRADAPPVPDTAVALVVRKSGYLQSIDPQKLLRTADAKGAAIRLRPQIGTHVIAGSTLGWAWPVEAGTSWPDADELSRAVHEGIQIGAERDLQQDIAFGVRQLVDIAIRALSPGINDPTTAVAAIDALGNVLAVVIGRDTGPTQRATDSGALVFVPRPTFAELLALGCDQPRRYGREEPAVLAALLQVLMDLAELADGEEARLALRAEIGTTVDSARDALRAAELQAVERVATAALQTLTTGRRDAVPGAAR